MSRQHEALILAAGRGSRLLALTDDRPKGLVELKGKSLVERQIATLSGAGIGRTTIVTGYLAERFDSLRLPTAHNPDWRDTNMVASMMHGFERTRGPLIVAYSDIVYQTSVIEALMACTADIAISYDVDWLDLWSRRFEDPLSDAESFQIDPQKRLTQIGQTASDVKDIQGQFMGLVSLSAQGIEIVREVVGKRTEYRASLDMTGLLNLCLGAGHNVTGVPTRGRWCEIDDQGDLAVAEAMMAEGLLDLIESGMDRA